jgi:hypothetical protein
MKQVTLFDPSLRDQEGNASINLGDLIIFESVSRYLSELFPDHELFRVSSHSVPQPDVLKKAASAKYIFFGGTNALSSDIRKYHQWKISIPRRLMWPFAFPVRNMVLMGVGWWQYQDAPDDYTRRFYRAALSSRWFHSVRDSYTAAKLRQMGFTRVLNTSCPTTWELGGMDVSGRKGKAVDCLFTLTDYMRAPVYDNEIIRKIAEGYTERLYFFPQGTLDEGYIRGLDAFRELSHRITIINRTFGDYVSCLEQSNIDYIGTRLHAGIKALQMNKNALILSVDNRAAEMAADIGLPVISRKETDRLLPWISGEKFFDRIKLPEKEIHQWKSQFNPNQR